jgi:hypothetical protein
MFVRFKGSEEKVATLFLMARLSFLRTVSQIKKELLWG